MIYPEDTFIELYKEFTSTTICAHLPDVYKKILEFSNIVPNAGSCYKKHGAFDKKRQSSCALRNATYRANSNEANGNVGSQARNGQSSGYTHRSSKDGVYLPNSSSGSGATIGSRGGIVFSSRRPKITSSNLDEYSTRVKDIGTLMNKITKTTYTKLYAKIFDILKSDTRMANECLTKLFTLVSLNVSLLDLYTQMFVEINRTFETECMEAIEGYIHYYINTIKDISNINPTEDYDEYCCQCKKNDMRRHLSNFFGCLRMNGAMDSNSIVNLIHRIYEMLLEFIYQPDHKEHVSEIVDNINILIKSACRKDDALSLTISRIYIIAELKYDSAYNEYPSVTSKSIFKCRDIVQQMKLICDLKN